MAKSLLVAILIGISLIKSRASESTGYPTSLVGDNGNIQKIEDSFETPEEDLTVRKHDAYEEDEEETECPIGQWWHIRGERCVPHICIGGNRFRDAATGECLIRKSFGQYNNAGGSSSLSRYNPRVQSFGKGNKGRLRFGLPTKVKG